jgi:NADPH:quinone reductase-like Zn-dependent oxidoreductase
MEKNMKASIIEAYGSPDVVQVKEVATPTPKDNEVLIRVHAASLTPSDCAFRKGDPFIIKVIYGFAKPKFPIGGVEFAGEIAAVGKDVSKFKVGEQVFGMNADNFGAHAEYLCLPHDKLIVTRPATMRPEEAVGIADGALTALIFLRDTAKTQPGQRVLINGASGAVGIYAVQLAKYYGAEVTGVCSTRNLDLVQAHGADTVIDYTKTDFTQNAQSYDVIFDAIGKSSFAACKNVLKPDGVYMTTVPTLAIVRDMLWTVLHGGKKAKFVTAGLMQNRDNLNFLKELFEAGKLQAVIDSCYPLDEIAEAYRYVESERKRGNVVIML